MPNDLRHVGETAAFNLAGGDEPVRVAAGVVAADFFSLLGRRDTSCCLSSAKELSLVTLGPA